MKVFISHKNTDQAVALRIQSALKVLSVEAYLDLLDDTITGKGEQLTKHIRQKLNECSDILVVLSESTKLSWRVPFEIGMAAQKDLPTVNYLQAGIQLPDYLSYWPRLKNEADIAKYVAARNKARQDVLNEQRSGRFNAAIMSETQMFYNELKMQLR